MSRCRLMRRLFEPKRSSTMKSAVEVVSVVSWAHLGMVRWMLCLVLVVVERLVELVVRLVDDGRNCCCV